MYSSQGELALVSIPHFRGKRSQIGDTYGITSTTVNYIKLLLKGALRVSIAKIWLLEVREWKIMFLRKTHLKVQKSI